MNRTSRFTPDQVVNILREQKAGSRTADICCKHGISRATFFKWKSKHWAEEIANARKLKLVEDENRKLKRLLADLMVENITLKEVQHKRQ
jgi:putative transposase